MSSNEPDPASPDITEPEVISPEIVSPEVVSPVVIEPEIADPQPGPANNPQVVQPVHVEHAPDGQQIDSRGLLPGQKISVGDFFLAFVGVCLGLAGSSIGALTGYGIAAWLGEYS